MRRRLLFIPALTIVLTLTACERHPAVAISETPAAIVRDKPGRGRPASAGNRVCIGYRIMLPNGRQVLSDDESCFVVGNGSVIAGMDEAVRGMRPGGERVVDCPPQRHWGRGGYGPIPPNTDIRIHLRLKSVD